MAYPYTDSFPRKVVSPTPRPDGVSGKAGAGIRAFFVRAGSSDHNHKEAEGPVDIATYLHKALSVSAFSATPSETPK